jgi:hypothetical protein
VILARCWGGGAAALHAPPQLCLMRLLRLDGELDIRAARCLPDSSDVEFGKPGAGSLALKQHFYLSTVTSGHQ